MALGLPNLGRVLVYRLGVKLGLNPVRRLRARIPEGPFFTPQAALPAPLDQDTTAPGAQPPDVTDAPPGVAAIVVLGGGWWPNDQWPSGSQLAESSALRLLEGVRLARALPDVPLLLTGADRQGEIPPVAWGYAQAARDLGIAPARPRLVLVTSAAHMPRALLHFQAVGLDPIPAPTQHLAGRATGRRLSDWLPSASKICARPSPPCMNTWACWPGAGIIRGRGRTGSTQLTRRLDLPRAPRE